jgi:hypothetical protein
MQAEFLKKYFPLIGRAALQRQMMNFSCSPNESFHQAWERFKDLLNACPHHGFEMWRLVSFFYNSLTADFKKLVSTICNGKPLISLINWLKTQSNGRLLSHFMLSLETPFLIQVGSSN